MLVTEAGAAPGAAGDKLVEVQGVDQVFVAALNVAATVPPQCHADESSGMSMNPLALVVYVTHTVTGPA